MPSQNQQIIQKAIDEKYADAATTEGLSESKYRWNPDDFQLAELTFGVISGFNPRVFGRDAEHDGKLQ
jgi:hypothetical protein